jgi:hypothetical protein
MHATHKILAVAALALALGVSAAPPSYASESGLALRRAAATPGAVEEGVIPVYPRYPYHAGHYPTADAYYDLPPYADIPPSWYRSRYFLTLRERGRYRYVPYVFTHSNYRD